MTKKTIFPVSYLSSQMAMTGLLVGLGLLGNTQMAADVGIVQGAALALFFGFSGNARSLILRSSGPSILRSILFARLLLIVPLGLGVYYLGSVLGSVAWGISIILILRKSVEWISELHISEAELNDDRRFARIHFVVQSTLLAVVGLCAIVAPSLFLITLTVWALAPLVISLPWIGRTMKSGTSLPAFGMTLLPHLGSTAVTGIGVYVFRLIVIVLVPKDDAGSLFTAFAMGGLLGSLFAFGFGASVVLHEQRTGVMQLPRSLRNVLIMVGVTGIAITAAVHFLSPAISLDGYNILFWQALGYSLIGSVVMVFAQRQRLRDLQHGTQDDVFAPDVLVNMIIVILIPAVFSIFGNEGMAWLYLINAGVALVFYRMTDCNRTSKIMGTTWMTPIRLAIAVLVALPVFVNLETGLFRSTDFLYESGGIFSKLPIPLSVLACYVGIALLGNYRRANLGLSIVFVTFVLMVLSTVSTTFGAQSAERTKLLLLLQYILPMFALVLGMMFEAHKAKTYVFEKTFLLVITVIVPLQLIATWIQGRVYLSPYLYAFSVYQHLQYVPVVLVSGYILALFSLWDNKSWRLILIGLSPVLAVYVTASASMTALGFAVTGCVIFIASRLLRFSGERRLCWLAPILFAFSFLLYNYYVSVAADIENAVWWKQRYREEASMAKQEHLDQGNETRPIFDPGGTTAVPGGMYHEKISTSGLTNLNERLEIWNYYAASISSDPLTLLFGQSRPPKREVWPSAHNYYLDFVFNFGLLAILPILFLICYTLWLVAVNRSGVLLSQPMIGLVLVVIFLVLGDNLVKVSMRMPYSGVVTFFLWGLLLSRLGVFREKEKTVSGAEVIGEGFA